jgi:hypothetical protein
MNITFKESINRVQFSLLDHGDTFMFDMESAEGPFIHIKIVLAGDYISLDKDITAKLLVPNYIVLNNGQPGKALPDILVIPVTLNVEVER